MLEVKRFPDKAAFLHYQNKLQVVWDQFMSGKIAAEDISIVPRRIVESWARSKSYGLNPYRTVHVDIKKTSVTQPAEKVLLDRTLKYWFSPLSKCYAFNVSLFDVQGYKISLWPDGGDGIISANEMIMGTNAAGLALLENSPSCVMAEEHFSRFNHSAFCVSVPFHDINQCVVGALSFSTPDFEIVCALAEMAEQMAPLCTFIFALAHQESHKNDAFATPFSKLANLSTPVQHIDDQAKIALLTQHARDLLVQYQSASDMRHQLISGTNRSFRGSGSAPSSLACPVLEWPLKTHGNNFSDIVGNSSALTKCIRFAKQAAQTNYSIMLNGENGVGKDLFAQSIHATSPRHDGPFVALNCGALASELVESELFGYEEGAFTGADQRGKIGLLEKASGGTLFLDEIESMPSTVQAKLLRVLSSGTLTRVGSTKGIPLDLRVISASKVDLRNAIKTKKFREDLFYRLSTVSLFIPPLRERKDDIPLLIQIFLNSWGRPNFTVTPEALRALCEYHWPGNVRELENALVHACIFSERECISLESLPDCIQATSQLRILENFLSERQLITAKRLSSIDEIETAVIRDALSQNDYVIKRTALALHIGRNTLRSRIRKDPELTALIQNPAPSCDLILSKPPAK